MNNLIVDIFIKNDVLISESIDLLFFKWTIHIENYNVEIFIKIYFKDLIIRRIVNVKKIIIIFTHFVIIVSIYHLDLFNRDFLFKFVNNFTLSLYVNIINKKINDIFVKNDINKFIQIKRNMKFGDFTKLIINSYYYIIIN